jgi:hypothetical protein
VTFDSTYLYIAFRTNKKQMTALFLIYDGLFKGKIDLLEFEDIGPPSKKIM